MRLLVAILWSLAALMWLPWFTAFVRFLIDLVLGVSPAQSDFLNPALVWIWPVRGWTAWGVVSWWPLLGALAMLLAYIGWRFFWWADDWRPSYRLPAVIVTIMLPPAALVLLYFDTRRRFRQRNTELHSAAEESLAEADPAERLRLLS